MHESAAETENENGWQDEDGSGRLTLLRLRFIGVCRYQPWERSWFGRPTTPVPLTMSADRTGAVYQALKPVTAEEKAWFAPPQLTLVQGAPFCRHGITDSTMVWIKLTAPGGGMIHINVEQVVSVRSDTQIPGANAQLDLASGKLQGVRENVDQVMRVITAAAGARANGECA